MLRLLIISLFVISTIKNTKADGGTFYISGPEFEDVTPKTKNSGVTCDQIIKACDSALLAKDKQLYFYSASQAELLLQNTKLSEQVADKQASLDAWYHSPLTMASLGFLAGLLGAATITKLR